MRTALLTVTLVLGSLLLVGCAQPAWRLQLQSEDPLRRIDGTIAAAAAKDRAATPLLVDRLQDDDVAVRMYAILALEKIEGTTLGYKFWADDVDRARMAQRWRNYLKARNHAPARAQASSSSPADPELDGAAQALSSQPLSIGGPR